MQLATSSMAVVLKTGEELKAATEQLLSDMGVFEKELREGFFQGRKFFGGDQMGLLDIVIGCGSSWFPVLEEFAGVKLCDAETFPRLSEVVSSYKEQEAMKSVFPDKEKLMEYAKAARVRLMQAPK